jgi:hypothetical protein
MERWDYELTHQLETLAKINLSYEPGEGLESRSIGIHHTRYFKYWSMTEYEENLDHPRYIDHNVQKNFPTIPPEQYKEFGLGKELDEVTRRWLQP